MSMLHEHVRLLGQFLRTDFKKIALLCALAMLAAIVLGFAPMNLPGSGSFKNCAEKL